jgi:hypothetical protein
MATQTPAFEQNHGPIAAILRGVDHALESTLFSVRDAFDVSTLASPVPAQNFTHQFAVNDVTTGVTRDFQVTIAVTETTGNSSPAPAPAYTVNVA